MPARLSMLVVLGLALSVSAARAQTTDLVFDPSLGVDLTTMTRSERGVYTKVLVEGQGEPAQMGTQLRVQFKSYLPDGTEVGRMPPGESLDFALDDRLMLPGFIEGLMGIRKDESRLIIIPPELGYGPRGAPEIPPGSTLVFRVTRIG